MMRSNHTKNTRQINVCGEVDSFSMCDSSEYLVCDLFDGEDAVCENEASLKTLIEPLLASESFSRLLDDIECDWIITFEHLSNGGYAIDPECKKLWIDTSGLVLNALTQSLYFTNVVRYSILRALREVWHAEQFSDYYDQYHVESLIQTERVRAADVESFSILCAYEVNLDNEKSRLWQHILGSEGGDIAFAFIKCLEKDHFSPSQFDRAMQFGFKQWYMDQDRVNSCDHRTLEEIDYLMEWNKDSLSLRSSNLKAAQICEMTQRGSGEGSYLGALNLTLLRDPAYSTMHDIVNETHLSHIMRDIASFEKGNVGFRSQTLAEKIFPDEDNGWIEHESLYEEEMVIR